MRILRQAGAAILLAATPVWATAPELSLRPLGRPGASPVEVQRAALAVIESLDPQGSGNTRFDLWIEAFKPRARAAGIRSDVLEAAFAEVRYDADAIRRDGSQAEFTKSIWDYLDSAVSDRRIANGQAALAEHGATLRAIEARYGVPKEVVLAVWGMESAYGHFRGSSHVISSLATLSFDGRRGKFFESQLIAALQILQAGDTTPARMTGSWAGAMGHTQFMPTSYLDYAVDFTGDGRRDIWSDDPTDALASTAAYLDRFGWVTGQPWGVEIVLPQGFNYALADRKIVRSAGEWRALGVRAEGGLPDHSGAVLLPAGAKGPAFMVYKNFRVIERYNAADAYVIGVGHLSDRIGGADPFRASWPRDDRSLSFSERKEMQRLLSRAGYSTNGVDGRIGPNTRQAIRAYQQARGLTPDGHPSLSLLTRLR